MGEPFQYNEEFLSLQPIFPPKPFDNFPPLGGCSEGLDAFRFCFNPLTAIAQIEVCPRDEMAYLPRTYAFSIERHILPLRFCVFSYTMWCTVDGELVRNRSYFCTGRSATGAGTGKYQTFWSKLSAQVGKRNSYRYIIYKRMTKEFRQCSGRDH